jgi:hypothetical protein
VNAELVRKFWRSVIYLSPIGNRGMASRKSSISLLTMLAITSTLLFIEIHNMSSCFCVFFQSSRFHIILTVFNQTSHWKAAIFLLSVSPALFFRRHRINFPAIRVKLLACKRLMLLGEYLYELFLPHCPLKYICTG